jgi:hypothetical protein
MQHLNIGLKIAALALLFHLLPFILHAQDKDTLGKPVRVKVANERLEDVLNDLARKGYFTFSYKSSILKKDRLITLTLRESTLRDALDLLLGKGYDYEETNDYVVIRRRKGIDEKPRMVRPMQKYKDTAAPFGSASIPVKKRRNPERSDTASFEEGKKVVRNIIADMVSENIVRDKDSFRWFGLDDTQFIVDGKPMADSLREKFRAKYIRPDGIGYYFGPVEIRGHGFFFDRNDIYGAPPPR